MARRSPGQIRMPASRGGGVTPAAAAGAVWAFAQPVEEMAAMTVAVTMTKPIRALRFCHHERVRLETIRDSPGLV
ncbi:protein of unknown function [Rhodovastum atsumiense]|nr:protein of unknown function [Rhodovastum atsumiense]